MLELFSYGFMQRALIASFLIGLVCALIGVFTVLKGIAFIGAGTAHAAFAGVTFAFLIGAPPTWMALAFGLSAVWMMALIEGKSRTKPDVPIGILYTAMMALAIFFIGLMPGYRPEVYGYLFGSILSVTKGDLWGILGLSSAVLLMLFLFFKEFHFISFDEETAEASGIPAKRLSFLLLNLIALTVVITLKAVGAILVFALLVIPAAAAQQWAVTMRSMLIYAVLIGVGSAWAGVLLSYWWDIPSGATIVLLAAAVFLVSLCASRRIRT